MAVSTTPVLLVTANVGSIFEDPSTMLKIWSREFLNTVTRLDPKFIALHCQEVGGKNYEESMKHVSDFVRLVMDSEELRLFDRARIYLDEDYSSAENFTALGNFYFIHESIAEVLTWDFKERCFVSVEGKEVFEGDIEEVSTKEKSKFPQDFFPECKWSRKGFLRTRWNLNGTVFDLVNIHLFHDASNFVAIESFPSVYSKTRQRALEYTLDRFHNDVFGPAPFFLFGDFNFRTDTQGVVQKLCDGLNQVKVNNNKNRKLEYQDADSQVVLTLGKKEFSHSKHQSIFIDDDGLWLKEFDKEPNEFSSQLFEFPISFPPSYPFVEDSQISCEYMPTRCPAWCDRVLLSHTARPLLSPEDGNNVEYNLIGREACMGDHKPVLLRGDLVCGAGRLSCCDSWLLHAPHTLVPNAHLTSSVIPPTIDENIDRESDSDEGETEVKFDLGDLLVDLGPLSIPPHRTRLHSESCVPTEESKPLTERYIVKRVHSASIVEVRVGLVKQASCKVPGEPYWRSRSVSISSGPSRNWRNSSRVKLISKEDLKKSLPRLQSHHSSSDEEWFEEVNQPFSSPALPITKNSASLTTSESSNLDKKCCAIS